MGKQKPQEDGKDGASKATDGESGENERARGGKEET